MSAPSLALHLPLQQGLQWQSRRNPQQQKVTTAPPAATAEMHCRQPKRHLQLRIGLLLGSSAVGHFLRGARRGLRLCQLRAQRVGVRLGSLQLRGRLRQRLPRLAQLLLQQQNLRAQVRTFMCQI